MHRDAIIAALAAYRDAVRDAVTCQQQQLNRPAAQQDWEQRDEYDTIERNRLDGVLVLVQQAINGGGR